MNTVGHFQFVVQPKQRAAFHSVGGCLIALLLAGCQVNINAIGATATDPPSPTVEAQPTRTVAPPVAATAADAATATPAAPPDLADFDWDDRSPFAANLVPEAQAVLEELPGASVYHIGLSIAPDLETVRGSQAVRYTNQEDVFLEEVVFRLYPNLLGGEMAISSVTVNGAAVAPILEQLGSVLRVPLPDRLAPGDTVVIAMDFAVEVPTELERNYGVLASVDGILALAHFYPLIAVYDDEGWNTEIPPPYGDVVYADASFYLVQVRAPAELVLATSGTALDQHSLGPDEQVVTYALGPARDFYIAASERYAVQERTIGDVTFNSYAPPEHEEFAALALDYAIAAIQSMSERYSTYPYTEFDVVATPNLALGIEYPGITAITLRLYDPESQLGAPVRAVLESTVAHEVGHQWFYNVVGNDQIDDPWLDESLTQFATWQYYADVHGEAGAEAFENNLTGRWSRVDFAEVPIGMPVGEYEGPAYSAIVYGRGPFFFEALSEEMGAEDFETFLDDYVRTQAWDIATGAELQALAEQHCDCDLTPLFEEWVYP